MKIIIHIGVRKTGTSTLQRYFVDNRESYLAHGILYPNSGRLDKTKGDGHYAHHNLAWTLADPDGRPRQWGQLWDEVRLHEPACVLLSAETFSSLSAECVEALQMETSGHEVFIVVVLRDQWALLLSEYKQQIKKGRTCDSLIDFARNNLALCDFVSLSDRWKAVFGAANVMVLDYETLRRGDLLHSFLESLALPKISERSAGRLSVNVSPDDLHTEAMRLLNRVERRFRLPSRSCSMVRNSMVRERQVGNVVFGMLRPWLSGKLYTSEEKVRVMQLFEQIEPYVPDVSRSNNPAFNTI